MASVNRKLTRSAHWDSAYLRQGKPYQFHDISPAIWQIGLRSPRKFKHLFTGPLPTFSANFMQICLEVFAQSC